MALHPADVPELGILPVRRAGREGFDGPGTLGLESPGNGHRGLRDSLRGTADFPFVRFKVASRSLVAACSL